MHLLELPVFSLDQVSEAAEKHLKLDKPDRGFQAEIGHAEIPSGPNGEMERIFGLLIIDSGNTILLGRIFERAQQYWRNLFTELDYLKPAR